MTAQHEETGDVRLKRENSGFIPELTERKAHNTPVSGGA